MKTIHTPTSPTHLSEKNARTLLRHGRREKGNTQKDGWLPAPPPRLSPPHPPTPPPFFFLSLHVTVRHDLAPGQGLAHPAGPSAAHLEVWARRTAPDRVSASALAAEMRDRMPGSQPQPCEEERKKGGGWVGGLGGGCVRCVCVGARSRPTVRAGIVHSCHPAHSGCWGAACHPKAGSVGQPVPPFFFCPSAHFSAAKVSPSFSLSLSKKNSTHVLHKLDGVRAAGGGGLTGR